jgi:hypothetical protein
MGVITTAAVLSAEAAAGESAVPAWVFGVTAFVVLGALLVVTMMIKVGD